MRGRPFQDWEGVRRNLGESPVRRMSEKKRVTAGFSVSAVSIKSIDPG